MAASVVLVDDADGSRITYNPPSAWNIQGSSFEHNSTTHALVGAGSAHFAFNGTTVTVYGTIPSGTSWSGIKCSVDGKDYQGPSTITSPTEVTYNFQYCSISDAALSDDREHTLIIAGDPSISTTSSASWWLYIDYILYTHAEGSSTTAVPPGTLASVVVDDAQTDLIKYDGPNGAQSWNQQGGLGEYGQTTHATSTGGATATFEFTGTRVEVYGTIAVGFLGSAFASTYSIDGGPSVDFDSTGSQDETEHQMLFFRSNTLQDGKHTLVITSTAQNSLQYFIDYIVYTTSELNVVASGPSPGSAGSSSSSPSSPSLASSSPSSSLSSSPSPPSPSSPSGSPSSPSLPPSKLSITPSSSSSSRSDQGSSSKSTNSNTGLIAGISIAAALVLAAIIVCFIFFLRRRRRRSTGTCESSSQSSEEGTLFASGSHAIIHPIIATTNNTDSDNQTSLSVSVRNSQHDFPSAPTVATVQRSSSGITTRTEKRSTDSWSATRARAVVQHHDGGVRLRSDPPEDEQEPEELPPVYQDQY